MRKGEGLFKVTTRDSKELKVLDDKIFGERDLRQTRPTPPPRKLFGRSAWRNI